MKPRYITSLSSKKLDTSDFILNAINILLENRVNPTVLKTICYNYLMSNYSIAIDLIKDQSKQLNLLELSNVDLSICQHNDDPMKNPSRRYFETNLAMNIWESQDQFAFESIQKLSIVMSKMNSNPKYQALTVTNLHDARKIIGLIREFCEETQIIIEKMSVLRNDMTSLSNQKDRGNKRISGNEKIYSCNTGIIKASSFIDREMLGDIEINGSTKQSTTFINKICDTFIINHEIKNGYSFTRKHVPFVNSISGTTYSLVAFLFYYIDKNKSDENLEEDIHHILKAFLAFTCINGYHSLSEMIDVFKDNAVNDIFVENNIHLNINSFFHEIVLIEAIKAAAHYSTTINLNGLLQDEIIQVIHHSFFKKNKFKAITNNPAPDLIDHLSTLVEIIPSYHIKNDIKANADLTMVKILNSSFPIILTIETNKKYMLELTHNQCKLSVDTVDRSIFGVNPNIIAALLSNLSPSKKNIVNGR